MAFGLVWGSLPLGDSTLAVAQFGFKILREQRRESESGNARTAVRLRVQTLGPIKCTKFYRV